MKNRIATLGLAAGLVLLMASTSRAEFRTQAQTLPTGGLSGGAVTMTLDGRVDDADTVEVWRRGWGWGGGWGWRGGWGWGWRGGWGWGRPAFVWGPAWGWGGGWGWGPRVYWGGPVVVYSSPWCFINMPADDHGSTATLSNFAESAYPLVDPYRYDGGPAQPVPMPRGEPQAPPPAASPLAVSLPARTRFAYPAYGERTEKTSFATDRR